MGGNFNLDGTSQRPKVAVFNKTEQGQKILIKVNSHLLRTIAEVYGEARLHSNTYECTRSNTNNGNYFVDDKSCQTSYEMPVICQKKGCTPGGC